MHRQEVRETIGGIFREVSAEALELSVPDKIWKLILDTILTITELVSADACDLLSALINENPKFHQLSNIYKLAS